jgi:SAM-dependent methyltransferase
LNRHCYGGVKVSQQAEVSNTATRLGVGDLRMSNRQDWEERYRRAEIGEAEPSVIEFLRLLPRGRALDIAAGTGRNSIALARSGLHVVAVDWSRNALNLLAQAARSQGVAIEAVMADLEQSPPFRPASFDVVLNISFLERGLFSPLKTLLRTGGLLLFDTFLIDQAAGGHPRNPRFLLGHYELCSILSDMELIHYREGVVDYGGGKRSWRATALARRTA